MTSRTTATNAMLAGLVLLVAGDVGAQTKAAPPTEERCLEAYEKGQRLRLKHALREARAELLLCARAPCPDGFRPECLQWFDEVQLLVPSVVVRVDGSGATNEVRVLVDGKIVATRLDGTPIELDPGEHVFRFEPKGAAPIERPLVINEGEKARVVTITVEAPQPIATTKGGDTSTGAHGASLTPWIFAGVGVVALGSFAYFGASGLSHRHQLDECNPYCQQGDIDATRRRFIIADVSLAISVVSFGIATYSWLSSPSSPSAETSAKALRFQASGGPGAAFAGIAGAF